MVETTGHKNQPTAMPRMRKILEDPPQRTQILRQIRFRGASPDFGVQRSIKNMSFVDDLPFDPILFQLKRLDIVATLVGEPPIPFQELKAVLAMTDGNLSVHLRKLEEHGMVRIFKTIMNRKTHTTITLSAKGIQHFTNLLNWFHQTFLEGQ